MQDTGGSKSSRGPVGGNPPPEGQGRSREAGSDGSPRCSPEPNTSEAPTRRTTAGSSWPLAARPNFRRAACVQATVSSEVSRSYLERSLALRVRYRSR